MTKFIWPGRAGPVFRHDLYYTTYSVIYSRRQDVHLSFIVKFVNTIFLNKMSRVRAPVLRHRHPYSVSIPVLHRRRSKSTATVLRIHCSMPLILWYTCVGRVIYINGHLESLGPTLKLFFKFTSFGCFLMCMLYWPSCGCYLIETVSSQCCPCWFISIYSTGINLCNISVLLSCIYAAHTGCSTDSECRCPYCRHSHF